MANLSGQLSGQWQPDIAEGVRWREIDFQSPTSLDDLFRLYFAAFEQAMPSIGPHWMCYPVLVADGVTCGCTPDEWKVRHRIELASMLLQTQDATRFKSALIDDTMTDVSHLNDMVVLLNEARGVVLHWGEDRTVNWADDLTTLIPIEQALLQRGQLASLEAQFAEAVTKSKSLEKLEHAIITGLEEYRSSHINPGEAQSIVDRILSRSRAQTGYTRLIDSVNQLHQKITAADAKRAARQANIFAFVAVLLTAALGLPAINESIKIADSVPEHSRLAFTAKPLVWLGEQGPAGTWTAFIVLIVLAVGAWLGGKGTLRQRIRIRRRCAGRRWDIPLELTFTEPDGEDTGVEHPS